MFGFKMPRMGGRDALKAAGSAMQGDGSGLAAILAQLGGEPAPMMNAEGQDISAAFGAPLSPQGGKPGAGALQNIAAVFGGAPAEEPEQLTPVAFDFPMTRRFGFGGR